MKYISISDLRKNITLLLENSSERICLTQNGRPIAVIMDFSDFQSTQAILALIADSKRKENLGKECEKIRRGETERYIEQ